MAPSVSIDYLSRPSTSTFYQSSRDNSAQVCHPSILLKLHLQLLRRHWHLTPARGLSAAVMKEKPNFGGYKWDGILSFYRPKQTHAFHDSIDWGALCQYASKLNNHEPCSMDPQITMGGCNLIRIINFANDTRWIARLRMLSGDAKANEASARVLQEEVAFMQLVKERTSIPVPTVFGYIADPQNKIGAPVMLIECLLGNTASRLEREASMSSQQRTAFYAELAKI